LLLREPVETINKAIAGGATSRRTLPRPVPAFLVYHTAFPDSGGEIAFAPDVYNRDDTIWQRLRRAAQVPVAQHNPAAERRG
jgi:murein L,D-transpeptidase YcbB/YkuD